MANTKEIILTPENLHSPEPYFLADKERADEYQGRIQKYGTRARQTLDIFAFDNLIKGSSPFGNVGLASDVLALPSQLEHAISINPQYFREGYEDIGLVICSEGDSISKNDYIAKNLAEQLKKRGLTPTPETPVRVSLKGLILKEDANSEYGLVFQLGEKAEAISVPEFSYKNNGKTFSETDERGVPIWNEKDNFNGRSFYARKDGLSRLYVYGFLNLYSYDGGLDASLSSGRVTVVSDKN